jgi:hypothetical protein
MSKGCETKSYVFFFLSRTHSETDVLDASVILGAKTWFGTVSNFQLMHIVLFHSELDLIIHRHLFVFIEIFRNC